MNSFDSKNKHILFLLKPLGGILPAKRINIESNKACEKSKHVVQKLSDS